MADSEKPKTETKPVPVREPWSDAELAALEPEVAELIAAEQARQQAQNRIVRIAHALRPGRRIDVQRRCWVWTEAVTSDAPGTAGAEGAD